MTNFLQNFTIIENYNKTIYYINDKMITKLAHNKFYISAINFFYKQF